MDPNDGDFPPSLYHSQKHIVELSLTGITKRRDVHYANIGKSLKVVRNARESNHRTKDLDHFFDNRRFYLHCLAVALLAKYECVVDRRAASGLRDL